MNDTRLLFDRVLTDEPPLALTLEPVVEGGRRIKRRRRTMVATGVLSIASVALLAVLPHGGTAGLEPTRPASSATTAPDGLTPAQRAIADAIVAVSPPGWTFDFGPERWEGNVLDTTVDDGNGASWFRVYTDTRLTGRRGAGTSAGDTEADGDLRRSTVVYVSTDGTGIIVTTANYLRDPHDPLGGIVTRAEPPYTEDQLHRLAALIGEVSRPYR